MTRRAARFVVLVLLTAGVGAAKVEAAPIQFGDNYYELIIVLSPGFADGSANTWDAASAASSASVFGGVNGHLATVTSAAENDFLLSLAAPLGLQGFQGAWLGGISPNWIVGPDTGPMTYTNWAPSEPNNPGYHAYMNIGTLAGIIAPGMWADDSGIFGLPEYPNDPVIGYFVEYESPRFTEVPEPSTLLLLAAGLAFAGRRRARRGPPAAASR